ncbi:MAG TPA: cupin domain-containing protein [Lautropia sp.]|nr:cupin domain-containing protein [Lautropia sp.]
MNSDSDGGNEGGDDGGNGRGISRDNGRDPAHGATHAADVGGVGLGGGSLMGSARSEIRLEGARPDVVSATGEQPTPMILRGGATQEHWFEEGCFITEWLNSPEDPALSIARARVLPGVTTRLHRLVGVAERYVILEGQGRVELVGPDKELKIADHYVSDVEPGDVVVIPPLVSQRISNIGETDLIFLALCTPRFNRAAYEDAES